MAGGIDRIRPPWFFPAALRDEGQAFRPTLAASGEQAPETSTVIVGQFVVDDANGNNPYAINSGDILAVTGTTYVGYTSTGVVNQNGGTFSAGTGVVLGAASGTTGTYNLNGGVLATPSVTASGGVGLFNFNGGTLQATANSQNFFTGLTTAGVRNGGAIIDTNGYNVIAAQIIKHSNVSGDAATDGGLTKNGTGTLTLSGLNGYTGPTTINAGTLAISSSANVGGDTTYNNGIFFNGTSALLATANVTLARVLIFGPNSTTTVAAVTGTTLTLQPDSISLNSNAQLVFGSAGNNGVVVLTGPVGYGTQGGNPTLTVATGTLRANGNSSVPFLTSYMPITTVAAGATLDYNGYDAHTSTYGNDVMRNLQGAGTVLTGGTATTNITIGSGNFAGAIGGPGQITKTTTDTLTLSGASTYTGGTTVSAGTLAINNTTGSGTGTGAVLVSSGATLSGKGAISGSVTVASGGTLSPGYPVGALSPGGLQMQSGSTLVFDLNPALAGNSGDHDEVDVFGAVMLNGCNLQLRLASAPTLGERFFLVLNDGIDPVTGLFAQGTAASASFGGQNYLFVIDYAGNGDGGAVGNDITLTVVSVPEPSAYALCVGLLIGGAVMACRRRTA